MPIKIHTFPSVSPRHGIIDSAARVKEGISWFEDIGKAETGRFRSVTRAVTDRVRLRIGQRIAVRTPDRREYRGELIELRTGTGERDVAVVRLDTGWLTSYPTDMVHPLENPSAQP